MALLDRMKCLMLPICHWVFGFFLVLHSQNCVSDTLRAGQVMRAGEALQSPSKLFVLYFHMDPLGNLYLTISCEEQYIWIANRNNPISNASEAALTLTQDGELVITTTSSNNVSHYSFIIINSDQSPWRVGNHSNTSLNLLDSGNLVLQDENRLLWQSFDYVSNSDTLIPGMKLGQFRTISGHLQNGFLSSWLGTEAPRAGAFTFGVDPNNTRQLAMLQRDDLYWHSGLFNYENRTFPFFRDFSHEVDFSHTYNEHENESYFTFTVNAENVSVWITLDLSGDLVMSVSSMVEESYSSIYITCGGTENGFVTEGCTAREPSKCSSNVFNESEGVMSDWWTDSDLNYGLTDCKAICMKDCSCTAYTTAKTDGTGCKFSKGRYQQLVGPDHDPEDFYLRIATSEIADPPILTQPTPEEQMTRTNHPIERHMWFIIGGSVFCFILILMFVFTFFYTSTISFCSRGERRSTPKIVIYESARDDRQGLKDHDLPFFSFSCVEMATNHFSGANKLGQGGFGTVYKGKLVDGQEIAVKRLSRESGQGLQDLKNEITLLSKLQHMNLVKLLGCCVEGEEKILIYEYMPNNSLDSFLFDATKRALLDWRLRISIIEGIAQGILYLHKYSRLRIIHRDLKTSNVLLDEKMNPKIGDFGAARIFSGRESPTRTKRIVGTYGYMSPEYAMDGIFSVKSDVFSFGVIVLEIVSGQKNTTSFQYDQPMNLLRHTWDLWKRERTVELMDPTVGKSCCSMINEVVRFVQVALLCVQERAADRPTMSDVVFMISNTSSVLPKPKQPAFSNILVPGNLDNPNLRECSVNHATMSDVVPR